MRRRLPVARRGRLALLAVVAVVAGSAIVAAPIAADGGPWSSITVEYNGHAEEFWLGTPTQSCEGYTYSVWHHWVTNNGTWSPSYSLADAPTSV